MLAVFASDPAATGAQVPVDQRIATAEARLRRALEPAVGHAWSLAGPQGRISSGAAGRIAPDGRDLRPEDAFRVYSVVKPMTAAALGRLLERGVIAAEQDVRSLVPEFASPADTVTLMQLATHQGGVRHYRSAEEGRSAGPCTSLDDALSIFAADPLVARPGTEERYSSWGFVLLSAAIAAASERPFDEAMAELVFEPADMTGIRMAVADRSRSGGAGAWTTDASGAVAVEKQQDLSCKYGAGGFVASPIDVARFGRALVDGTLLSEPLVDLFFRGDTTFVAQGSGPGGVAVLATNRTSGWSVALVSNTSGPGVDEQIRALALEALAILSEGSA